MKWHSNCYKIGSPRSIFEQRTERQERKNHYNEVQSDPQFDYLWELKFLLLSFGCPEQQLRLGIWFHPELQLFCLKPYIRLLLSCLAEPYILPFECLGR